MHVAIVSPYDPRPADTGDPHALRGGVEETLDRTAAGLARRGHQVTLVCSARRPGVSIDEDGVRVVRIRRHGSVFRVPLAALARNVPPDADIVHVPATYPGVSDVIPLRLRARRPVVVDHHFDVHGTSVAMRLAATLHHQTLGRALRAATRVIVRSRGYAAVSPAIRRIDPARVDEVPNGIDPDAFPLSTRRGNDILCVGRLVPYKGVETLIRAMPRIHAETDARLKVVGDGPERARLAALVAQTGAPVELLGRVPSEMLALLYGTHRVTVLPSANGQEAFGIVLLESMATGTPVVASALPGVRDIAALAGLTVPPLQPDALARAVIRAWREPRAFGSPQQIRDRVCARYAWPVVLDRLEECYARAVGRA